MNFLRKLLGSPAQARPRTRDLGSIRLPTVAPTIEFNVPMTNQPVSAFVLGERFYSLEQDESDDSVTFAFRSHDLKGQSETSLVPPPARRTVVVCALSQERILAWSPEGLHDWDVGQNAWRTLPGPTLVGLVNRVACLGQRWLLFAREFDATNRRFRSESVYELDGESYRKLPAYPEGFFQARYCPQPQGSGARLAEQVIEVAGPAGHPKLLRTGHNWPVWRECFGPEETFPEENPHVTWCQSLQLTLTPPGPDGESPDPAFRFIMGSGEASRGRDLRVLEAYPAVQNPALDLPPDGVQREAIACVVDGRALAALWNPGQLRVALFEDARLRVYNCACGRALPMHWRTCLCGKPAPF